MKFCSLNERPDLYRREVPSESTILADRAAGLPLSMLGSKHCKRTGNPFFARRSCLQIG